MLVAERWIPTHRISTFACASMIKAAGVILGDFTGAAALYCKK
jgi:hypothetical protein